MHNILLMQVTNRRNSLAEELKGLGLVNDPVLVLVGEERAILSQLHNHINHTVFY